MGNSIARDSMLN